MSLTSTQHSNLPYHITRTSDEIINRYEADNSLHLVYSKYKILLENLFTKRLCIHCRNEYMPIDNYRRYNCNVHPRTIDRSLRPPSYRCCKASIYDDPPGCTPCMHVYKEETLPWLKKNYFTATVNVPQEFIDFHIIKLSPYHKHKKEENLCLIHVLQVP